MTGRRRRCFVTLVMLIVVASAADGWGYWTQAGLGSGAVSTGSLVAATLSTPSTATNAITVTWAQQATLAPSSAANSSITYSVERQLGSGSFAAVSGGGCGGSKTYGITSCVDALASSGSYSYRVVANYATWTAMSAVSGPVALLVDTTPPTVTSIVRAAASPTNATSVSWTVTFTEAVTGVGTTDFALAASGLTGATITGVTGSGTSYTVTASNGTGSGTLGLNVDDDDTIIDAAANRLGGTGTGNGNLTGPTYTIDKTAPAAGSIVRAAASPTNATSVSWTVTFTEAVTGVGTTDFALAATGPTGATITGVTGTGTTYTVTASSGTGSGTLGLNLVDDDTILDGIGNQLGGVGTGNGNFTGQIYTIDKTPPTANSIVRAAASPINATSVSWTVTFTEAVTGVGTTDFALAATGPTGATITGVTGSGTTYTVTASSGTGNGTLGLNLVDDDSIIDGVSIPVGGVGTGNGNFTGQAYTIDKTAPTAPSSLAVPNAVVWSAPPSCTGVTSGTRYINGTATSASASTVAITANVGEAGLMVTFSATSAATNVTATVAAGATTVSTTKDLSGLAEGAITLSAYATDAAGNTSSTTTMGGVFIKDTVVPTLTAVFHSLGGGGLGLGPHIDGTASECDALITAEKRPTPGLVFTTTSTGLGSPSGYDIDPVNGVLVLGLVSYDVTATDRAGNVSAPVIT